MKRKTIDTMRETRLWMNQIVKPVGETILGLGLLAREFGVGEHFKKKELKSEEKGKVIDISAFERITPKREFVMTDDSLRLLDAAARFKHLENLARGIDK